MSITINGRTYTTLEDELCVGGKQLRRVEVNGRQVYPEGPGYCDWLTKYIEGTLSGAVIIPDVTYVGEYAFVDADLAYGTPPITFVSLAKCERIERNAFYDCTGLSRVVMPLCSDIGPYAFIDCRSLTSISFPMCSYIGSHAFESCYSLTSISFPMCSYIGNYAFINCRELMSAYFMASSVVTVGIDAFYRTPIDGYGSIPGYIYVPSSLYSQYIMSSVWSRYSSHIIGM